MRALPDISSCSKKSNQRSLDESTVSEEDWLKAEKELTETPEKRSVCLKELRDLLKGETNLNPDTSDEFLLPFLRAKKFKTEKAFTRIKNYYGHRHLYPHLYQNYSMKQSSTVMDSNLFNFLPWRTPDGCAVWVSRVGSWDPKDFTYEEFLKFGIRCHEKALHNPVTQICGIVTIVDLDGFSWSHLVHFPPSMVKCFVSVAQDCLPIRHKAIHIINNPRIFGLLFTIMKPFMTRKIRNRIFFHGRSLSSLHEHMHPSILPEEFGGTRGPFENRQFYESLLESDEEFREWQTFGYRTSS